MAIKNKEKSKAIEVKAVPDHSIISNRKYSNFVQVQNTLHDVTMRFCDITPIYNMPEFIKTGKNEHNIPVIAEITIPVNMVPNLIKALQQKYDEYQRTYNKEIPIKGESGNA